MAAAAICLAAGVGVAAGILILPDYVPTAEVPVYRSDDEPSSKSGDVADGVRTLKGLAATVLEPNEDLSPQSGQ